MTYELFATARTEEQIEKNLRYLAVHLQNPQAARHFVSQLEDVYQRLEENPYQFPECAEAVLAWRGYRQALFREIAYRVIFRVEDTRVYVVGLFHERENHADKL